MGQEMVRERVRPSGFAFFGFGVEQRQPSVICGRASTWQQPRSTEDDDFEPNIVRGRE
ncbi:hypothetical protein [Labedaea rhizosphaerae]|uniref:Uncharacterized protein n=1 Tax=Labedaea rhizosphaerae TaxID=598644 RepID=A0A4R6SGX5_LABRH|nr:hypothetical protein [Labedaea rhizosphaerae]TDQ01004.1 hypothetical protein EV186_102871 [Labedaea rhizosphaerae]